jgi:hypothetical protein
MVFSLSSRQLNSRFIFGCLPERIEQGHWSWHLRSAERLPLLTGPYNSCRKGQSFECAGLAGQRARKTAIRNTAGLFVICRTNVMCDSKSKLLAFPLRVNVKQWSRHPAVKQLHSWDPRTQ